MTTVFDGQCMPFVSIVTPCFNAESTVARSVASALSQSYPNVEVIVVNDGSTDGSLAVLQQFSDRIIIDDGPNRGGCAARNRGMSLSKGEYFLFLDADDYIEPDTIASMVEAAVAGEADIVFAPFVYEWPNGERELSEPRQLFGGTTPVELLDYWISRNFVHFVPPVSVLWRGRFLLSVGGWSDGLPVLQDVEVMLRALFQQPKIAFSDHGLGVYVQHDSPSRVSQQQTPEVSRWRIKIWSDLRRRMEGTPFEVAMPGLGRHFYRFAHRSCILGMPPDIAKSAVREARRCGLRGHPGSRLHSIVATVLGLHNKERLSAALSRFRRVART